MTAIRIENFGGEYPSLSGQALPGDGAQRNVNLYAAIREFRPLMEDKNLGVSAPVGIQSIYRTQRKTGGYNGLDNETANWMVSAKPLSYVKGQVNDDATERTYFTTDDGSDHPKALDLASVSSPRKLGVPAPEGVTAAVVTGKSFTLEDAPEAVKDIARKIRSAVVECTITPGYDVVISDDGANLTYKDIADPAVAAQRQKAARYTDYVPSNGVPRAGGVKPRAGPKSSYGMGPTEDIAQYLPASWRDLHWRLHATRPLTEMQDIFGSNGIVDLGGVVSGAAAHVALDALPYCLVPDKPDPATGKYLLETRLRAIKNPKDDKPLFDDKEITNMLHVLIDGSRPQTLMPDLLDKLDACVKTFATKVLDTTKANLTPGGSAGPAPVKPTQPTVAQWSTVWTDVYDPITDTTRRESKQVEHADWIKYRADLERYNTALAAYNQRLGDYTQAQAALVNQVAALQAEAVSLSAQIEAKVLKIWTDELTNLEHLEQALVDGFGGVPQLFDGLDATRVKEARFYVATHVTDWGEESAPSAVTEMLEPTQYDTVDVTVGAPPAGRFIEKIRIYRSNAGSTSSVFQFVTELDATAQTLNDDLKAAQLGEGLATTTWLEPPAKLKGLVGMPNGIMAGFFDNTVAFCDPYHPYAWPVEYQITTEHPIVGLAAFGQTLFVGTTGSPYFISGSDSASMSALKMDSNQACTSRGSIVAVQGGVIYASPDGLCVADGRGVSVLSQGIFTREDWQALQPSTMIGAEHESIYYLFYKGNGGGVFTLDMASKKLTRLQGLSAGTVFVDKFSDAMYYANTATGTICRAYGGTVRRTGLWKSGRNPLAQHATLAWAQIEGFPTAAEPVILRLYGDNYFVDFRGDVYEATADLKWKRRRDGVLFTPGTAAHDAINYTVKFINCMPQRLPFGRWRDHEIEIESRARVTRVTLAGSTEELKAV